MRLDLRLQVWPQNLLSMQVRLKLDITWSTLCQAAVGWYSSEQQLDVARSRIQDYWPNGHVVIAASARTMFDALLSELALAPGEPVIMSAINIQNMADIVIAHGLRIVPVDIDAKTLAPHPGALLEAQAETNARLCVVAQLFGAVSNIGDAAVLRQRGVFVIEDAAQAFAGTFYRGSQLVDVSLFSLGPIKRSTALGGGIGVLRDADLARRVECRLQTYQQRSNLWFRRRALKYGLLKALSIPFAYKIVVLLIEAVGQDPETMIGEAARGFSGTSLLDAIRTRPPTRMIALMADRISEARDCSKRRNVCIEFLARLPGTISDIGSSTDKHAYWLLPIRVADPVRVVKDLRLSGFDATRGTTSLRALAPTATPMAKSLMEDIVYLPHPDGLTVRQRNRLAKMVGSIAAPPTCPIDGR